MKDIVLIRIYVRKYLIDNKIEDYFNIKKLIDKNINNVSIKDNLINIIDDLKELNIFNIFILINWECKLKSLI